MSSLILNNLVICQGDIKIGEPPHTFIAPDGSVFQDDNVAGAYLIDAEPPSFSPTGWVYANNQFYVRDIKDITDQDGQNNQPS